MSLRAAVPDPNLATLSPKTKTRRGWGTGLPPGLFPIVNNLPLGRPRPPGGSKLDGYSPVLMDGMRSTDDQNGRKPGFGCSARPDHVRLWCSLLGEADGTDSGGGR